MGYNHRYFGAPVLEATPAERARTTQLRRAFRRRRLWWWVCDAFWGALAAIPTLIKIVWPMATVIIMHMENAPAWAHLLFGMAVVTWIDRKKG